MHMVSIIIIHYRRSDFLKRCLESIRFIDYPSFETIVVCNSPVDEEIIKLFPEARFIGDGENLGYARGCNLGIEASRGEYIFILNNDIEFDSDCLSPMVELCEKDPEVAMVQPKILSLTERDRFEYSGAAGGLIDIFGYPFARGRIFTSVEYDKGQYDDAVEIFWASGAALFARKSAVLDAGLFDTWFFTYMEEIDLAWRILLLGYKIVYTPKAKIYHIGSPNIDRKDTFHLYLNHRNNFVMVLKNYSLMNLLWVLPLRLLLEFATTVHALLIENPRRALAVLKALKDISTNMPLILKKRKFAQSIRKINDADVLKKMYNGSIALQYFLRKRKTVEEIPGIHLEPYDTDEG